MLNEAEDMELLHLMSTFGEVARTSRLRTAGTSRRILESALRDGDLFRVKRGWVATVKADAEQVNAIRRGGRIGCISALSRWGVWAADDRAPHIAMGPGGPAGRMRFGRGLTSEAIRHPSAIDGASPRPKLARPARLHWTPTAKPSDALEWIVSPADALAQAVRCQSLEHAVACVDSALHHEVVSDSEWREICHALPLAGKRIDDLVDSRADSGLESRIRVRLTLLGHTVNVQVPLTGFGNLDLVIDGLLGLELDGDRFHATPEQRQRDATKVLVSLRSGLPVLRVGYAQAINDWNLVYDAITQMLLLSSRAQFRKSA